MNKKYVTTKKRPVERSRFHDFLVEISSSKWRLAADGKDGVFKKISLVSLSFSDGAPLFAPTTPADRQFKNPNQNGCRPVFFVFVF